LATYRRCVPLSAIWQIRLKTESKIERFDISRIPNIGDLARLFYS